MSPAGSPGSPTDAPPNTVGAGVGVGRPVRVVDARPTLAAGGEPFGMIMDAVCELGDDEALVVWAPFEPVPLEGVLAEQGFDHRAEVVDGAWRTTFWRP